MPDDQHEQQQARAVQVTHACGHTVTHLVPVTLAPDRLLVSLTDAMLAQPCPACVLGMPEWAIEPVLRGQDATGAGTN